MAVPRALYFRRVVAIAVLLLLVLRRLSLLPNSVGQ